MLVEQTKNNMEIDTCQEKNPNDVQQVKQSKDIIYEKNTHNEGNSYPLSTLNDISKIHSDHNLGYNNEGEHEENS